MSRPRRMLLAALLALVPASCDDEGQGPLEPEGTSTSSPTASGTSSPTTVTSSGPAPTEPRYGSACQRGSHPDCVDPDQDGQYELLRNGAACLKDLGEDSGLCSDLDGDGVAGYPDSG